MLSNVNKGKIVLLRERGYSYLEISIMIRISLHLIKPWYLNYVKTGKI